MSNSQVSYRTTGQFAWGKGNSSRNLTYMPLLQVKGGKERGLCSPVRIANRIEETVKEEAEILQRGIPVESGQGGGKA